MDRILNLALLDTYCAPLMITLNNDLFSIIFAFGLELVQIDTAKLNIN